MQALDLAAARERALRGSAAQTKAPDEDVLVARDHVLNLTYVAPDGVTYAAAVISRIPSFAEKQAMARMEADLCLGRPWDSFQPARQGWMQAVARVAMQLHDPPPWLLQWAQEDDELLAKVSAACRQHEALFFRADLRAGPEEESRPRVVLDANFPPVARVP